MVARPAGRGKAAGGTIIAPDGAAGPPGEPAGSGAGASGRKVDSPFRENPMHQQ